jgi:hypothetical protein
VKNSAIKKILVANFPVLHQRDRVRRAKKISKFYGMDFKSQLGKTSPGESPLDISTLNTNVDKLSTPGEFLGIPPDVILATLAARVRAEKQRVASLQTST